MAEESKKPIPPPETQPTSQTSVQSPSTPSCCSSLCCSKTLLIPLLLAVLAIVLGVGYLVGVAKVFSPQAPPVVVPQVTSYPTPTPDPTANWKTYANTAWKISFKYPNDWQAVENQGESGMLIQRPELEMKDYSDVRKGAFLYGPYVPGVLPYSWDKVFEGYTNDKVEILNENITLDGQPTKVGLMKKDNVIEMIVYYKYPSIWKDTYNSTIQLSYISLVSEPKEFEKNQKIFDQILSTFRFLE